MNKSLAKSPRWMVLMSGVCLIAFAAPIFAGSSALAGTRSATTAGSGYLQVADNQLPPPLPKNNKSQGQQHNNQSQGQQHYNNQSQGQQHTNVYQGQQFNGQYQGQQQSKTYAQPKVYVQPKVYAQPQGQQYNGQYQGQQHSKTFVKTYVQPKVYVQPQGQQYNGQYQGQQYSDQHDRRYDWSTYQPGRRPPQWDEYHHNFDPHPYEWNRYAERRYHWEPYREPEGWYYQQWVFGETFPPIFWTQNYWINDYWDFGLPNPPYGYVWVRYGPDALLVAVDNGQILSVVYSLFA